MRTMVILELWGRDTHVDWKSSPADGRSSFGYCILIRGLPHLLEKKEAECCC